MNSAGITLDRGLQLIALRQLQKILREPSFSFANARHLIAAESLWCGAHLARMSEQRELRRSAA